MIIILMKAMRVASVALAVLVLPAALLWWRRRSESNGRDQAGEQSLT